MLDVILGIDIAKAKFDVCLLSAQRCRYRAFPNNEQVTCPLNLVH